MIDFHCHLDLYKEPEKIIAEVDLRGVGVLSVTTTPSAWKGTAGLASSSKHIRTALGLHPELAARRLHELPQFDALLAETKFVGEVGLDGSPNPRKSWAEQEQVFRHVLDVCADSGGKTLTLHTRRAVTPALDMLASRPGYGRAIMHWFTGSMSELARGIDLGCWFGLSPAMLSTAKGRSLAARIPQDRVVLETDGPFGAVRGETSMPWHVRDVPPILAKIWEITVSEATLLIERNERLLVSS